MSDTKLTNADFLCRPLSSYTTSLTDVLVQEADEGGGHNIPVFTAELHRGLDAVIHHQRQVFVDGVRAIIGELIEKHKQTKINKTRLPLHIRA